MKVTKYLKLTLLCLFIIIIGIQLAFGLDQPTVSGQAPVPSQSTVSNQEPVPKQPPELKSKVTVLTDREYILSIGVLLFGLIIVFCEVFLATKDQENTEEILRLIVITIIVISGLFIITAGLSENQVAPAFGLYGAITGYLLGKESKTKQ